MSIIFLSIIFQRPLETLSKIEALGESAVVMGDLNKHIGDLVKDNHNKVSPGGNLIRELI